MKSKTVAQLLADLGVNKSFSRPQVSNDNPYSEAHFKTLKYHPEFPNRFGCIQDARSFCRSFFQTYNEEHRHSSIALMTPSVVHSGKADLCNRARQDVLNLAYKKNPERFENGSPRVLQLPKEVWINKPKPADTTQQIDEVTDDLEVTSHKLSSVS